LLDWIRGTLVTASAIDPTDVDLLRLTDDPAEACRIIRAYARRRRDSARRTAPDTVAIEAERAKRPRRAAERES
jgi:hypothetical protein